jgi:hypothetical protein
MRKVFTVALFGLAPIFTGAADVQAAGKTIDMGYIDQSTIIRACQQAGTVPFTGGQNYGCRAHGVSITCDGQTCTAVGSDLASVTGNSLRAVLEALDQRAGRRILPVDTRVEPANQRVR